MQEPLQRDRSAGADAQGGASVFVIPRRATSARRGVGAACHTRRLPGYTSAPQPKKATGELTREATKPAGAGLGRVRPRRAPASAEDGGRGCSTVGKKQRPL